MTKKCKTCGGPVGHSTNGNFCSSQCEAAAKWIARLENTEQIKMKRRMEKLEEENAELRHQLAEAKKSDPRG